jgi:hypothetical protein
MGYDTKCHDLAQSFVEDSTIPAHEHGKMTDELAQEIQDCIENFLSDKEPE